MKHMNVFMPGFGANPTIIKATPSAMQKMIGPVRSVSFIMLPSAGLKGFNTVRAFCQMWSKLMPSSRQCADRERRNEYP